MQEYGLNFNLNYDSQNKNSDQSINKNSHNINTLQQIDDISEFKVSKNSDHLNNYLSGFLIGEFNSKKAIILNKDHLLNIKSQGYEISAKKSSNKNKYSLYNSNNPELKNIEKNLGFKIYKIYLVYDIIEIDKRSFENIYDTNFRTHNVKRATNMRLEEAANAYIFNNLLFRSSLTLFIILILSWMSHLSILGITFNIIFFISALFKIFLLYISAISNRDNFDIKNLNQENLPVYTIIVPLFREAAKVRNILKSISNINYPTSKLDVKIVVEEDDVQTIKALYIENIPHWFSIVKVPNYGPKTKPKACNYAARLAKGEFLVVYDAEDKPEPDQLLKAVSKFRELGNEVACLQAILKINNNKNNLLCNCFKFEYEFWFAHMLFAISKLGLPITLGGTSNHFRTVKLKDAKFWDPYNVTEDAELGIRLNLKGYEVHMLNSTTEEEGPLSLLSWIKQRVRWIKGFMITYIVYLLSDKSSQKISDKLSIHFFVGFSFITFLGLPFIIFFNFFGKVGHIEYLIGNFNLISFLALFWTAPIMFNDYCKKGHMLDILTTLIFPLYFILHSISSFLAVLEILFKPFRWNKTDHGM